MIKTEFITSYLTFYLKGLIEQQGNLIRLSIPNTVLAFIPLGHNEHSVPVNQIASVTTSFRLKLGLFFVGLCFLAGGMSAVSETVIGGLLVAAVGLLLLLSSFQTLLAITTTGGIYYVIPFIVFEKAKAENVKNEINQLINERINDTNTRQQTDRVVDAINNK